MSTEDDLTLGFNGNGESKVFCATSWFSCSGSMKLLQRQTEPVIGMRDDEIVVLVK